MVILDLHGFTVHNAWKELTFFLHEYYYQKNYKVTVICGHGAMKQEIEQWLKLHPRVKSFKPLKSGGSYEVKLEKK